MNLKNAIIDKYCLTIVVEKSLSKIVEDNNVVVSENSDLSITKNFSCSTAIVSDKKLLLFVVETRKLNAAMRKKF